jgi:hypothetical protein
MRMGEGFAPGKDGVSAYRCAGLFGHEGSTFLLKRNQRGKPHLQVGIAVQLVVSSVPLRVPMTFRGVLAQLRGQYTSSPMMSAAQQSPG